MPLIDILNEAVSREASDVLIIAGLPVSYKVSGRIDRVGERLFPDHTQALLEDFRAGDEPELEATLPMTENQSLYVRFRREEGGAVTVLDWRTVLTEEEDLGGSSLPVYGADGG